ncbi:Protein SPDS-1 b [Aphelenchoides avenae]|nr:Protein SPDS-1 b [Aphelenchus avenae]
MDLLHKGWFTEFSPDDLERLKKGDNDADVSSKQLKSDGADMGGAWPGQAFSLQVEEVLFHERSKYQDVLVFKSRTYGNVLVLDGIIQCTERDEHSYQEMLTHLPMFAHPNPRKVLIIGGGDGGILREVLKHDTVERVTMCEIDELVVDVSKKYLPHMSKDFGHPKLDLHIGDGFDFLKNHKDEFDVVITDSSDPVGPAESLFGKSYYELINDSLRAGGILSSQGECPWIDLNLIKRLVGFSREVFPTVQFAAASVPTYTSGYMGYLLCCKEVGPACSLAHSESLWLHVDLVAHMVRFCRDIFPTVRYASSIVSTYPSGSMGYLIASKEARGVFVPSRELTDERCQQMGLRFYNSQMHRAAFALPTFVKQALEPK